ncbi:MAG: hypothetical protein V1674_02290 [Candidatus Omnitrophota bacterium]
MDKERLREIFHPLFNKISNISIAAGSNIELLRQESKKTATSEELSKKIAHLTEVLAKIEENASALNEALSNIYDMLSREDNPGL